MGRVIGWPERLNGIIDEWRDKPFVWGKSDCVSFCSAVESALYDGKQTLIPKYTSKTSALKQLSKCGGLTDEIERRFTRSSGRRGDLALVDTNDGPALCIVLGDCIAGMGPDGLVFLPIKMAISVWSL